MPRQQDQKILEFILANVQENPASITMMAARHFGYSRTGIARYLGRLVQQGLISAKGTTRARTYTLALGTATTRSQSRQQQGSIVLEY